MVLKSFQVRWNLYETKYQNNRRLTNIDAKFNDIDTIIVIKLYDLQKY